VEVQVLSSAYGGARLAGRFLLAAFGPLVATDTTATDRSGPGVGGPELGAEGRIRDNGTAVLPCAISGTITMRFNDG
jgi:hypothetical protein